MCTTAWKDQGNLEYKLGSIITGVISCGEWSNALGSPPRSSLLDWCLHLILPSCWEYWPRMAHSCHFSGELPLADGSGLVQQYLGSNASTILRWPEVNEWPTWGTDALKVERLMFQLFLCDQAEARHQWKSSICFPYFPLGFFQKLSLNPSGQESLAQAAFRA